MRPDEATEIRTRLRAIIEAMKAIDFWQEEPLPPAALSFRRAFGADTMSFPQWLQFVLVPRVESILAGEGTLPDGSALAVYAARDLDGLDEAAALIARLREFDALVDRLAASPAVEAAPPPEPAGDPENIFAQDPVFAVRGYVIGLQGGFPEAVRARVTRASAAAPGLDLTAPFLIEDFRTEPPEYEGDRALVRTRLIGRDDAGAIFEWRFTFVLVREDGEWKIDVARTRADGLESV
ncbi:MAG: YqcC family protein [Planctomycetota bacterium]